MCNTLLGKPLSTPHTDSLSFFSVGMYRRTSARKQEAVVATALACEVLIGFITCWTSNMRSGVVGWANKDRLLPHTEV